MDSDGLMIVPTDLWAGWLLDKPFAVPVVVAFPAYRAAAYRAPELVSKPTAAVLAKLDGAPVRLTWLGSTNDGVLVVKRDQWALLCFDGSLAGSSWGPVNLIESVGRIELAPKAKRRAKLRYRDVLAAIETRVVGTRCKGATVVFELRLGPDGRIPPLTTTAEALRLVTTPLSTEPLDTSFRGTSPLARALNRDLKALAKGARDEITTGDVLLASANGFVISFELDPPDKNIADTASLDAMSDDDVRAVFTARRPVAKLSITMTDAALARSPRRHRTVRRDQRPTSGRAATGRHRAAHRRSNRSPRRIDDLAGEQHRLGDLVVDQEHERRVDRDRGLNSVVPLGVTARGSGLGPLFVDGDPRLVNGAVQK